MAKNSRVLNIEAYTITGYKSNFYIRIVRRKKDAYYKYNYDGSECAGCEDVDIATIYYLTPTSYIRLFSLLLKYFNEQKGTLLMNSTLGDNQQRDNQPVWAYISN
jgi:hypothetical protein